MARLDAEAAAAVDRPSRSPTSAEALAYLEEPRSCGRDLLAVAAFGVSVFVGSVVRMKCVDVEGCVRHVHRGTAQDVSTPTG